MKNITLAGLIALVILHQDFWLWNNPTLLAGVLPIGLAYHIFYVLIVFVWMILLVKYAWPDDLTDEAAALAKSDSPAEAS